MFVRVRCANKMIIAINTIEGGVIIKTVVKNK